MLTINTSVYTIAYENLIKQKQIFAKDMWLKTS